MIDELIHQHNFFAMGSHMSVWVEADDGRDAHVWLHDVAAQFAAAEAQLSRFRPTSDLSQLNAQPERWVRIPEGVWQAVRCALRLAEETDGLFDPTLLNALTAAGYGDSFERLPVDAHVAPTAGGGASRRGRYREVLCDPTQRALWLPAGVALDLGGIGKGFTAQVIVDGLTERGIPCLIDAGGDLTAGLPPSGSPGWPVGVSAPGADKQDAGENLLRLWLNDASLATSGVDYRRWRQNGRDVHHIIDPRTGEPAETDLLTVTVLAEVAAAAEAWATVGLIIGESEAYQRLCGMGEAAVLIGSEGHITLTTEMIPLIEWESIERQKIIYT